MKSIVKSIATPLCVPVTGQKIDSEIPFTIEGLFAHGENGFLGDISESATIWQDIAGTVPAAVNSPLRRVNDISGNGNNATEATDFPYLRTDVVNTQPSTTATSGVNLATQPKFNVLTTAGTTDTSYTGPVTITAIGAGTLSGTLTVNAVAGVVTYSGIKVVGAGVTQILAYIPTRGRVLTNNITVT